MSKEQWIAQEEQILENLMGYFEELVEHYGGDSKMARETVTKELDLRDGTFGRVFGNA